MAEIKLEKRVLDEIIEKNRNGGNFQKLAKEYGIHQTTLGKKLRESGYSARRKSLSQEVFEKCVERYNSGEDLKHIAKSISLSWYVLKRIFSDSGIEIDRKYKRLEKITQIESVICRYKSGESAKEIAKDLEVGGAFIREIISDAGIKRTRSEANRNTAQKRNCRKYAIDESVFNVVTEESAYWIGFLMADGCVYKGTVGVAIQKKDGKHLEKFRDFLKTNRPIKAKSNNCDFLVIRSSLIAESLKVFGVTPKKSATAKVNGLEFNRHFWRGVIDGDGSIFMDKSKNIRISLVGSLDLINQFLEYVKSFVETEVKVKRCVNTDKVFRVKLSNKKAFQVIQALYDGCNIYLDRKYEIAKKTIMLYQELDGVKCWREKRNIFKEICYNDFR